MGEELADWGDFLRVRHELIHRWTAEGQSAAGIAETLSMDPMQVTLIAMTSLDETRVHSPRWMRSAPPPPSAAEGARAFGGPGCETCVVIVESDGSWRHAEHCTLAMYREMADDFAARVRDLERALGEAISVSETALNMSTSRHEDDRAATAVMRAEISELRALLAPRREPPRAEG